MGRPEGTEGEEGTEISLNRISGAIIGAAIEVHRALGPGLLESAYQECLVRELLERGHRVEWQKAFPIIYRGTAIRRRLQPDLVVDGQVLVELKAVKHLLPVHESQVPSYLRLAGLPLGLLINFHCVTLIASNNERKPNHVHHQREVESSCLRRRRHRETVRQRRHHVPRR